MEWFFRGKISQKGTGTFWEEFTLYFYDISPFIVSAY